MRADADSGVAIGDAWYSASASGVVPGASDGPGLPSGDPSPTKIRDVAS